MTSIESVSYPHVSGKKYATPIGHDYTQPQGVYFFRLLSWYDQCNAMGQSFYFQCIESIRSNIPTHPRFFWLIFHVLHNVIVCWLLQPFNVNPLTHLWRTMNASCLLIHFIIEYVKLVEIAVVHVLGMKEDERCFPILKFLKNKLRNSLDKHMSSVLESSLLWKILHILIPLTCGWIMQSA